MCSFSKEITQTSVKGTYVNVELFTEEVMVDFMPGIELNIFEWNKLASPPAWSDAKDNYDKISLNSKIMLKIQEKKNSEYFTTNT
jgi:hypothetical protein